MDPEAEKNAVLFAELIEYREALAALKEFGLGFDVSVERRWPSAYAPYYVVSITEHEEAGLRSPVSIVSRGDWPAQGNHVNLLEAVRVAVRQARKRKAPSYTPPTPLGMPPGSPVQPTPTLTVIQEAVDLNLEVGEQDPPAGPGRAVAPS